MKKNHSRKRQQKHPKGGATLVVMIFLMAALLVLLIGTLSITRLESGTAQAYSDQFQAELMLEAGLEESRKLLRSNMLRDDFVILREEVPTDVGGANAPFYYLARPEIDGSEVTYSYSPLFSSTQMPRREATLRVPRQNEEDGNNDFGVDFYAMSGQDQVADMPAIRGDAASKAEWIEVSDENGKLVGRYAFWIEDAQRYLDAEASGNTNGPDGIHERSSSEVAAPPGMAEQEIDSGAAQVALFALFPEAEKEDQALEGANLDNQLIENRNLLVSPESVLAAAEAPLGMERDSDGRLVGNEEWRILEEATLAGLQPYEEQALVPPLEGIEAVVWGRPQKNLNELLQRADRNEAVIEGGNWIEEALPDFVEQRPGGFPDDYEFTLMASMLDYADVDLYPTVSRGSYWGVDSSPFVSEFFYRFAWYGMHQHTGGELVVSGIDDGDEQFDRIDVGERDPGKYLLLRTVLFVELWNMANQEFVGDISLTYETDAEINAGYLPSNGGFLQTVSFELGDSDVLGDEDLSDHSLSPGPDGWEFAPVSVQLEPNEHQLVRVGEVIYTLRVCDLDEFIIDPVETAPDRSSSYKLFVDGVLVDESLGSLQRFSPPSTLGLFRDWVRTDGTIAGHSSTKFSTGGGFYNNMGDPRMSRYLTGYQSVNSYPQNHSPSQRNIRNGSIYRNGSGSEKVYGRVMPSEWPDRGHDSLVGNLSFTNSSSNRERVPDHSNFLGDIAPPEPAKAPMRVSNSGVFFSESSWGNIYDPLMWDVNGGGSRLYDFVWPSISQSTSGSSEHGGGNTLRIGRPEHPRFDAPGLRASHLLDLFHAGQPYDSAKMVGGTTLQDGKININTASKDAIRAVLAGKLEMDEAISRVTLNSHSPQFMSWPTEGIELGAPTRDERADEMAEAIIENRPISSLSQAADFANESGQLIFGNPALFAGVGGLSQSSSGEDLQWSDGAAEELFGRLYNSSSVRSRNFRVFIEGQAIRRLRDGTIRVEGSTRRMFQVFVDPGVRKGANDTDPGGIIPENSTVKVLYERAL
ncbi:MAG: hypothetical protein AAF555_04075 [Verrucomicrobiota bacterium]